MHISTLLEMADCGREKPVFQLWVIPWLDWFHHQDFFQGADRAPSARVHGAREWHG